MRGGGKKTALKQNTSTRFLSPPASSSAEQYHLPVASAARAWRPSSRSTALPFAVSNVWKRKTILRLKQRAEEEHTDVALLIKDRFGVSALSHLIPCLARRKTPTLPNSSRSPRRTPPAPPANAQGTEHTTARPPTTAAPLTAAPITTKNSMGTTEKKRATLGATTTTATTGERARAAARTSARHASSRSANGSQAPRLPQTPKRHGCTKEPHRSARYIAHHRHSLHHSPSFLCRLAFLHASCFAHRSCLCGLLATGT